MANKANIKFDDKSLRKNLMKNYETMQAERLVAYAIEQMNQMGNELKQKMLYKPSDRTHNMLNSLVWAVYYDGKEKRHGFYRNSASTKGDSYLHELDENPIPVNGRALARQFLATHTPSEKGWEIVWGVLVPYYAYWEEGHENVFYRSRVKFAMMTQHYDQIKNKLGSKVNVTIEISVPRY